MIKTRINNEYKDIIKIFGGSTLQKEITKVWSREANKYVYESSVEYTGTLPITIKADGNALIDYCIYGNTVQDSTPTPENPVDVVGCGVRTENLFDKNTANIDNGYIMNGFLQFDGRITTKVEYHVSEYIKISQNQSYILFYGANLNNPSVCFYDDTKKYISGVAYSGRWRVPFTTPQGAEYLRISFRAVDKSAIMLNTGSTALPYEPYGYKLPILSNTTVTNIYLGEVETTRRIKKLVLTGEEQVLIHQTIVSWFQIFLTDIVIDNLELCTHYKPSPYIPATIQNGEIIAGKQSGNDKGRIVIRDTAYTTVAAFKSYLAAQYAAGTPVTVWYVLAEPETAVVNEPLMKIGDYADTVSMEQADVSIPTFADTTVIDYDGETKPSQMYIKYRR